MERNNQSRTRSKHFFITVIVASTASIYSCMTPSQFSVTDHSDDSYQQQVDNANKKIRIASNVNVYAVAKAFPSYINSPYVELKPALSPGADQKLYFSRSNHPGNTGGAYDNEDIWYSKYDSMVNTWSEPVHMPGILNNEGPNFICNVSVTGDSIALGNQYLKNGRMKSGCSFSVNNHGIWSAPRAIVVKNDYNISEHAGYFLSLEFGVIISAVERVETYGSRDLYVSFRQGAFSSEPINMGYALNSDLEEASPHLSHDGMTLYFASKGHGGYGGYDIFVSHRLDDSWTNWTEPENLGPAVNGPMDDEFFIISHCGKFALFSKQITADNVDLFGIPTDELFIPSPLKHTFKDKTSVSLNLH